MPFFRRYRRQLQNFFHKFRNIFWISCLHLFLWPFDSQKITSNIYQQVLNLKRWIHDHKFQPNFQFCHCTTKKTAKFVDFLTSLTRIITKLQVHTALHVCIDMDKPFWISFDLNLIDSILQTQWNITWKTRRFCSKLDNFRRFW